MATGRFYEGAVKEVTPVREFGENKSQVCDLVIVVNGDAGEYDISFSAFGKNVIETAQALPEGAEVRVYYGASSRKAKEQWFTTLRVLKVETLK